MIADRTLQKLILDGQSFSPEDIKSMSLQNMQEPYLDLFEFLKRWFDDSPYITVHTSGSTGQPKALEVEKLKMMHSAQLTCQYLGLKKNDSALLCMNLKYIGAMMVVVRALLYELNLTVISATGHPLKAIQKPFRFAAMVPLQVFNSLQIPEEKERLQRMEVLIIGGGAVDEVLLQDIKTLYNAVYSTYGMTETLSHIALRRLNGADATTHYRPFAGIHLALAPADNTLIIDAPMLVAHPLHTNDVARIYTDGSFLILGRKDNVVNSGGIKIQIEEDEQVLKQIIDCPFALTSVPDTRLEEALILLIQQYPTDKIARIAQQLQKVLPAYHLPRAIYSIEQLPLAGNGKIDRKACRETAKIKEKEQ